MARNIAVVPAVVVAVAVEGIDGATSSVVVVMLSPHIGRSSRHHWSH